MSIPLLENNWVRFSKNTVSTARLIRLGQIILIIWCVASIARVATSVLSTSESISTNITESNPNISSLISRDLSLSPTDLEQLKAIHLFGLPVGDSKAPVVKKTVASNEELNATKTKLDLKLQGVMYSAKQQQAVAVITYKRKEGHYLVGTKLPISGQVEVVRILEDKVILSNNGSYEALWLYSEDQKEGGLIVRTASSETPDHLVERPVGQQDKAGTSPDFFASSYRQSLYKKPETLKDAIRISPATIGGKMIGYRLSPGKNAKDFSLLGLKTNDIVTQINDIQLDGPKKAMELYQLMETAKQANLTIRRGDESIELQLDLNGDNS